MLCHGVSGAGVKGGGLHLSGSLLCFGGPGGDASHDVKCHNFKHHKVQTAFNEPFCDSYT